MTPVISQTLPAAEGAYIVGGTVRDILMGREPADYDLVVAGDPEGFARQAARQVGGSFVRLGRPDHLLFRVASKTAFFDVSPLNGDSITQDLHRRDFTINALAYHLADGEIIDCTGGKKDLASQTIRMVSGKAFTDDPVRMVRAFRFGAVLGFEIEKATLEAVRRHGPLIRSSATERIRAEIFKMFASPRAFPYLKAMIGTGLLYEIIPEMRAAEGCGQNRFHTYDVLAHTLKVFEEIESLIRHPGIPGDRLVAEAVPDDAAEAELKFAALIHDIAKPEVRSVGADGNVHFYGHEKAGEKYAAEITRRLRCSVHEIRRISFLVRNHLRPLLIYNQSRKQPNISRASARFFMKCGDQVPALLVHAAADNRAKGPGSSAGRDREDFEIFTRELYRRYREALRPEVRKPPLLNGGDLIREFALKPSPLFGRILNAAEEARLSGEIESKSQALDFAKKIINEHSKS